MDQEVRILDKEGGRQAILVNTMERKISKAGGLYHRPYLH